MISPDDPRWWDACDWCGERRRRLVHVGGSDCDFLCDVCAERWWDIFEGIAVTYYYLIDARADAAPILWRFHSVENRVQFMEEHRGKRAFLTFDSEALIAEAKTPDLQNHRLDVMLSFQVDVRTYTKQEAIEMAARLAEEAVRGAKAVSRDGTCVLDVY